MRTPLTVRPAPINPQLPLLLTILTVVLAILGTAGCATISGEPFSAFAASAEQLRDGADASLGALHEHIRDRYIDQAAAGDQAKIRALLLTQPEGDPFGWKSSNPPLFLKEARFREGVYQLNSVLIGYAGLLGQLASPELVKPETFDQLATDLNGNLKTAIGALGVQTQPNKEIAIISTVASGVFRAYLQNKQRSTLLKALEDNQATIDYTAELGAEAVRITAIAIRNEYDIASTGLAVADSKAIKKLVELDERFIKELAGLRILYQSYEVLPAAHRELATGLAEPQRGLPMIRELYENGRDLYRLYERLSKEDNKKREGKRGGGS